MQKFKLKKAAFVLFLAAGLTLFFAVWSAAQRGSESEGPPALTICVEKYWDTIPALPNFHYEHPEINLVTESLPEPYDHSILANYEIDLETVPPTKSADREAALSRIKNQLMAGDGPDVFWLWMQDITSPFTYQNANSHVFSNFEKAAESGIFMDLKPLLTQELLQEMSDPFQNWVERQEHIYYLPLGYQICGALLPRASWQAHPDLLEAETDHFRYFQNYAAAFGQDSLRGFTGMLPCMALAKTNASVASTAARPDFTAFLDLQSNILHAQGYYPGAASTSNTRDRWCDALSSGQAPFQGEACYDFFMLNSARILSGMGDDTRFSPVPNDDGGVTAIVTSALVARSNTQHPEIVQQLIESFLSEKMQRSGFPDYGSTYDNFPVRAGMLADMLSDTLSHNWDLEWPDYNNYPEKNLSPETIQSFLDAESRITHYILPDDSALALYNAYKPYCEGSQPLERTQYEIAKEFLYYSDE